MRKSCKQWRDPSAALCRWWSGQSIDWYIWIDEYGVDLPKPGESHANFVDQLPLEEAVCGTIDRAVEYAREIVDQRVADGMERRDAQDDVMVMAAPVVNGQPDFDAMLEASLLQRVWRSAHERRTAETSPLSSARALRGAGAIRSES